MPCVLSLDDCSAKCGLIKKVGYPSCRVSDGGVIFSSDKGNDHLASVCDHLNEN